MLHVIAAVTVKMPDGTEVISIGEMDTVVQVENDDAAAGELALVAARVRSMLANLEQRIQQRCDEFVEFGRRNG